MPTGSKKANLRVFQRPRVSTDNPAQPVQPTREIVEVSRSAVIYMLKELVASMLSMGFAYPPQSHLPDR